MAQPGTHLEQTRTIGSSGNKKGKTPEQYESTKVRLMGVIDDGIRGLVTDPHLFLDVDERGKKGDALVHYINTAKTQRKVGEYVHIAEEDVTSLGSYQELDQLCKPKYVLSCASVQSHASGVIYDSIRIIIYRASHCA